MSARNSKPPTLKTIAEMTGLSLSTVSLSLRDGSNLKQSTRDKVAEAAREIGYVPNRAGVRLRTGRSNVLALVLSTDQKTLDYTQQLIQGIGSYIKGTRYHLSVVPEFDHTEQEEAVRYILENRAADGVIITHTSARDPRVQMLMDADFPLVTHGRTEFYSPHAYHDFDAERFVELAIDRLESKGRRRVLLAAVDNGTTNFFNTVAGFKRSIAQHQLMGEVLENVEVLSTTAEAREFGRTLAQQPEAGRFDAIICNNELVALSIISGLEEMGISLGQDYDLICKQTTKILPILYPNIDTIAEDLFTEGSELARLLIARIDGAEIDTLQTLNEPVPKWRS
uniref:HTH lacI-type domain-containing protein n=1 Tax=uncultured Thiotrichaceae bacterium TaxID=298394 RepID=A0A6S6U367_9GAMM|nr:MAG: Unknown protein [uncultured Thiotrichaceae bacterium]